VPAGEGDPVAGAGAGRRAGAAPPQCATAPPALAHWPAGCPSLSQHLISLPHSQGSSKAGVLEAGATPAADRYYSVKCVTDAADRASRRGATRRVC